MLPLPEIVSLHSIWIRQRKELAELFGFETRNKYSIDTEDNRQLAFAAEQQKGIGGFFIRQFLGHWRRFDILLFDSSRNPILRAVHPFRFFFQRLTVLLPDGEAIGHLQRRFSIFTKRFDLLDAKEQVLYAVSSPIWRLWTFPFKRDGREFAVVRKRWGGILKEAMLDADQFQIEFVDPAVTHEQRLLIVSAGIFIDLMYFEEKAGNNSSIRIGN